MALPATAIIEVRTTGNDANGGGFNSARGGTDYSQQGAAQASGTASSSSTTVTATTSIFTSAMVGNYITDGTTWCEITAFTSGTVVTVDRAPSWTSASVKVGGALATPSKAINTVSVSGNTVWIKTATYTISAALVPPAGSVASPTLVEGYNSSRGDLRAVNDYSNFPTIQNNNTSNFLIDSGNYIWVRNLICDGGAGGTKANLGIRLTGGSVIDNCKVLRWSTNQAFNTNSCIVRRCLATQGASGSDSAFVSAGETVWESCVADSNGCKGFRFFAVSSSASNCNSINNTGVGFYFESTGTVLHEMRNCIAYNNSSDGLSIAASAGDGSSFHDCIFELNGGYGVNSATSYSQIKGDYNAFKSNTSGARNNVPAGPNDVTLSADPFTNAASGDFSLNTTSGGGAACRAAGFPGVFPGGTSTGYLDIGAVQHADPTGGAAGMLFVQNLEGV